MTEFIVILYVFLIFYNPVYSYIPLGNYIDEFLCLALMGFALLKFLRGNGCVQKNENFCIVILCIVIAVIGFFSNILYGYMNNISVIFRDCLQTFKFFITYICTYYLFQGYRSEKLKKYLIIISKLLITIIFIFGVISLFVNIGMGDSIRYGIRSYKFIYSHYTYLVFNEVILLCTVICENKKNIKYYAMSVATLAFTLRTKAVVFIVILLVVNIIIYFQKNKKTIKLKDFMKLRYIVPLALIVFFVSKSKITEYISWGMENSIRVGMHYYGAKMMLDHFPIGTGFGTYGTNISYGANSVLYNISKYGNLNYSHLLDYGEATISDVYWPSIYVQFGIFGCILFVTSLILIIKGILKRNDCGIITKRSAVCIMLYLISASIAEAVFSNESGVFAPFFIVLIMSLEEKTEGKSKGLSEYK